MRILIISDIHSNYEALEEVLGEKHDMIIFSGDAVDYGPDPDKVLERLMEINPKSVMGNHDAANAFNIDCRCSEEFHDLSIYTRNFYKNKLNKNHIDYLANLPYFINFEIENYRFTVVHGSLEDYLYDYVRPNISEEALIEKFKFTESDFVIFGHTHLPFVRKIGKTTYINPGSLGQPRDFDNRMSYAILDLNDVKVEIRRKRYDFEKTMNKIRDMDMDRKYKDILMSLIKNGGYREGNNL
ncbi:MAG: metallophosphoesterase family protein [Thermoplasmata archaeon]